MNIALIIITIILCLLLFYNMFSTKKIKNTIENIQATSKNDDFEFIGRQGKITAQFTKNSYLGFLDKINKEDKNLEIIVYSSESLKKNDKFEIEGLHGTKIVAKKI